MSELYFGLSLFALSYLILSPLSRSSFGLEMCPFFFDSTLMLVIMLLLF